MVDYDAFKGPDFKAYLASLDKARSRDASTPRERLAYWINVYNAYTIELINEHRERDSIRNINKIAGHRKANGPWHEKLVKAGGKVYHLDNVEHDIIRKQWNEPRIHFALVCAAMGCPPLRSEAYTGARLEEQLHGPGAASSCVRVAGQESGRRGDGHGLRERDLREVLPRRTSAADDGRRPSAREVPGELPSAEGPEKQLLLSGQVQARRDRLRLDPQQPGEGQEGYGRGR